MATAVVLLHSFLEGGCVNEIYSEVQSPGNKYKAVAFQRDCGATTGFSTQISILNLGDALENDSGDIYIIAGHPERVSPKMIWINDRELVIETTFKGDEYKAEKGWGMFDEVKITYSTSGS